MGEGEAQQGLITEGVSERLLKCLQIGHGENESGFLSCSGNFGFGNRSRLFG